MSITTPILSYLQDTTKTLPMLVIEVPTTLGRTYQGYKRGGETEGREKICEETLGAGVWLFGVSAFNKIGDIIGEKIFKLDELNVDVGKDSLRNPFENVKNKRGFTSAYKFGKIAFSAILGTLAMGIAVPKIKMAMTNAFRMKNGLEPYVDKNSPDGKFHPGIADKLVGLFIKPKETSNSSGNFLPTFDKFISNTKENSLAFRGSAGITNGLMYASHNLENNIAWKLLSTDGGTLAGRVVNSRTKKEGIEYFIRDAASSFAYIFAAPLFSSLLRQIANLADINPKTADETSKYLKSLIGNNKVSPDYFTSNILTKDAQTNLIKDIKFEKNQTIWLEDFNRLTNFKFKEKAELMSKLQPKLYKDGVKSSILSKKQIIDIMSNNPLSDPIFLKETFSRATKGKSDDPKAYVSRKKLEKMRDSIDDFTLGLQKYAKNKEIDSKLIDKYTKNLNRKNLAVHLSGMGFAIFLLAWAIPKFQYFVSEKLTGQKGFAADAKDVPANQ